MQMITKIFALAVIFATAAVASPVADDGTGRT